MSRPPYAMSERAPELAQGTARFLDEKQQRLGKLVNRDRARILFDDGRFEELLFPEVDDDRETPIGLKVYRGKIAGVSAYAYAGDFSIRGGALGEREGKKLAASVRMTCGIGACFIASASLSANMSITTIAAGSASAKRCAISRAV